MTEEFENSGIQDQRLRQYYVELKKRKKGREGKQGGRRKMGGREHGRMEGKKERKQKKSCFSLREFIIEFTETGRINDNLRKSRPNYITCQV